MPLGFFIANLAVFNSDFYSFNNPDVKDLLIVGSISFLASNLQGYCFLTTGSTLVCSSIFTGSARFDFPGLSVSHTLGYT